MQRHCYTYKLDNISLTSVIPCQRLPNTDILDDLNLKNIVHARGLKRVQTNNKSYIYYFSIFIRK